MLSFGASAGLFGSLFPIFASESTTVAMSSKRLGSATAFSASVSSDGAIAVPCARWILFDAAFCILKSDSSRSSWLFPSGARGFPLSSVTPGWGSWAVPPALSAVADSCDLISLPLIPVDLPPGSRASLVFRLFFQWFFVRMDSSGISGQLLELLLLAFQFRHAIFAPLFVLVALLALLGFLNLTGFHLALR